MSFCPVLSHHPRFKFVNRQGAHRVLQGEIFHLDKHTHIGFWDDFVSGSWEERKDHTYLPTYLLTYHVDGFDFEVGEQHARFGCWPGLPLLYRVPTYHVHEKCKDKGR